MIFNLFEAKKTKSESQGRIPGMNGEERVKKSPSYHTRQNSSVDATCAIKYFFCAGTKFSLPLISNCRAHSRFWNTVQGFAFWFRLVEAVLNDGYFSNQHLVIHRHDAKINSASIFMRGENGAMLAGGQHTIHQNRQSLSGDVDHAQIDFCRLPQGEGDGHLGMT